MKQEAAFPIQHYLEIGWRRKWWIILPFVLSGVVSAALVHYLPKTYLSSTMILVEPQKVPENYVKPSISGTIEDRLATIRQQLQSRSLLQKIIDEFGLYQSDSKHMASDEVFEQFRKSIDVRTVGNEKSIEAFTISYEGQEPMVTMKVTNKLASLFIEENLKFREQLLEGASEFLDSQLTSIKESLDKQEAEISEYKKKNMGELPQQLDANLRTLDRYQMELQSITTELKIAEDRKTNVQKLLSDQERAQNALPDSAAPSTGTAQPGLSDGARLEVLRQELARLRAEYKDTYPDIVALKTQIEALEEKLSKQVRDEDLTQSGAKGGAAELNFPPRDVTFIRDLQRQLQETLIETRSLRDRQKEVLKQIDLYQRRVENTPQREQQLMTLMRDYENTKKNYQELLDKKLNAQLSENLEKRQKGEQFRILDSANLPQSPNKPDPIRILGMGLAVGLGVGLGLAFVVEAMDTSFKRPEEVEESLGLPVLVSVPLFDRKRVRIALLDPAGPSDLPSRQIPKQIPE